jgi:hypothetical protein
MKSAPSINALLIVWNMGLIFQWGVHLIPARGPISWRETINNQFWVVPKLARQEIGSYMTKRKHLMDIIEKEDFDKVKSVPGSQQDEIPN